MQKQAIKMNKFMALYYEDFPKKSASRVASIYLYKIINKDNHIVTNYLFFKNGKWFRQQNTHMTEKMFRYYHIKKMINISDKTLFKILLKALPYDGVTF